jgi:hypothetical protein
MKVKSRKGKLVLHLKEGALHKDLHVKQERKIPQKGDSPLNAAGWKK